MLIQKFFDLTSFLRFRHPFLVSIVNFHDDVILNSALPGVPKMYPILRLNFGAVGISMSNVLVLPGSIKKHNKTCNHSVSFHALMNSCQFDNSIFHKI